MKTKRILAAALAVVTVLAMTGCGGNSAGTATTVASKDTASAGGETKAAVTIKYSTWANEGEAAYEGMKKFKELVEAGSGGEIVVELYPSNQAGSTNEQVEQVSMNQLQMMSSGDPGVLELEYLCLPYLFDTLDQYTEFMESDLGKTYIQKSIDERKCRILDTLPRSPRVITSNIEINSLADMKNMKIRVPERDYYVKTFEAFGTNPTPMDMGEVYSAMQTGVVEGQENPIETAVSYGFQNVNKYLVLTNHIVKPAFVMINDDFYNGLSEEYQKLISDSCREAREFAAEYMETAMEKDRQTCVDAGMTVCEPDLEEFVNATQSVRDELGVKIWGEDGYAAVKAIAGK
ncbi:MAG: TRAP transporter substrate-binding protein [Lachnospiraceae bacterium]|nr:TRAP transporter substrate-binding protein [Lachnospiraceae bacterium]